MGSPAGIGFSESGPNSVSLPGATGPADGAGAGVEEGIDPLLKIGSEVGGGRDPLLMTCVEDGKGAFASVEDGSG